MRDRISRPQNLPPVLALLVDDGGEVWLARSHRFESTSRWLRLRSNGSVRDTVAFPGKYRIVRLQRDTVWIAVPDIDDLETLSRCTIKT
jgi:hypothetical protein